MSKVSQFTIYQSSDAGAPTLSGTSGSLVTVLDACLVTGYGSKPSAGWNKPIPNESGSRFAVSGSVLGCWQNSSGSGMILYINDDRPNNDLSAGRFREAWATGWETLTNLNPPVGVGSGQFPTAAQLLTTGHVAIRKSSTVDSTARYWIMLADQYTFNLYVQTGDGYYYPFSFGDFYSLKTTTDSYRCMIRGRIFEANASILSANASYPADSWVAVGSYYSTAQQYYYSPAANVAPGLYSARAVGGLGTSVNNYLFWDNGKTFLYTGGSTFSAQFWIMTGFMTAVNTADNSISIGPLYIGDAQFTYRGRMRGQYVLYSNNNAYADGQILQGSGDYAGKTFMCIRGMGEGLYTTSYQVHLYEISNTVETND